MVNYFKKNVYAGGLIPLWLDNITITYSTVVEFLPIIFPKRFDKFGLFLVFPSSWDKIFISFHTRWNTITHTTSHWALSMPIPLGIIPAFPFGIILPYLLLVGSFSILLSSLRIRFLEFLLSCFPFCCAHLLHTRLH